MENGNVVAIDEGRYLAAIGNVAGSQGNAVVQAVGKFVRHLGVEQDEAFNLLFFPVRPSAFRASCRSINFRAMPRPRNPQPPVMTIFTVPGPGYNGGYLNVRVSPGVMTTTLVLKLPKAALNCSGVPFNNPKVP